LRDKKVPMAKIAVKMGVSPRQVAHYLAIFRDLQENLEKGYTPEPEPTSEMYAAWCLDRLGRPPGDSPEEWLEEFECFFNEFSNERGGLQPHSREWVRRAFEGDRVLLNCPPGHAKSTVFTVFLPLWLIARDRNIQICIISATESGARGWARKVANHMENHDGLIQNFGRFKPDADGAPWRPKSGELTVQGRDLLSRTGDFTLQIRGAGQQILGKRFHWVIVDDAVERDDAYSETKRARLSEWFHGDVLSRLETDVEDEEDFGHAVVIGQRLHLYDLYGQLAEEVDEETGNPVWLHLNYRAVVDWETQEVLWPEKWTWTKIMRKRRDLGATIFECMFQQNPLAEGAGLSRRAWIYGSNESPGCLDMDRPGYVAPVWEGQSYVRVLSLDPSQSASAKAGLIVSDVPKMDQFQSHVIEVMHENLDVRGMLYNIDRCYDMYGIQVLIFEQNTAQRWFLQDPRNDYIKRTMRVIGHNTGRNKADPTLGIESMSMDFELGNIRFPYGDADGRRMSELVIKEALQYPQGLTDDTLMSNWFIRYNWQSLFYGMAGFQAVTAGGFHIPPRLQNGWEWNKKRSYSAG